MTHEHHDRDIIVKESSSGMSTILAVIVVLLLLAAVWWFAFGPGTGSTTNEGGDVEINVPIPSVEAQPPSS